MKTFDPRSGLEVPFDARVLITAQPPHHPSVSDELADFTPLHRSYKRYESALAPTLERRKDRWRLLRTEWGRLAVLKVYENF
jgi:hypothetical protein